VSQVMGYHTSYLDHFLKTQNFILRGDGPLPFHYRHYIAIMVSQKPNDDNTDITLENKLLHDFLIDTRDAFIVEFFQNTYRD
jgi:hypothetical protein